jgi:hypothetical protein
VFVYLDDHALRADRMSLVGLKEDILNDSDEFAYVQQRFDLFPTQN